MAEPARSEFHVEIKSSETNAVDVLAEVSGLSKQRVKMAMQRGAVWLTSRGSCRRIRRAKKMLRGGDELDFYYDEKVLLSDPVTPTLIVDEGNLVVYYRRAVSGEITVQ